MIVNVVVPGFSSLQTNPWLPGRKLGDPENEGQSANSFPYVQLIPIYMSSASSSVIGRYMGVLSK